LLALIAGQDVEPVDDSDGTDGRWRIAQRVAPDCVISVVDPDARHAHKTVSRSQDGYRAHVAVEPDTGMTGTYHAMLGRWLEISGRGSARSTGVGHSGQRLGRWQAVASLSRGIYAG
jgi:hypothetical protein